MHSSNIHKNTLDLYKAFVASHASFNALSAIQNYLVNDEQRKALKNLSIFGKFLRRLSQSASEDIVQIDGEIALLEHYFAIEQVRFENRLIIEFVIQKDIEKIGIPGLILLAFAEEQLLKFTKIENNYLEPNSIVFHLNIENNCIVFSNKFTQKIVLNKFAKYSEEQQNRHNLLLERINFYKPKFDIKKNENTITINEKTK